MKISKSKRQLAQLLIEAGVTQFPEGANWAAQDRDGWRDGHPFGFYTDKPHYNNGSGMWNSDSHSSTMIDETHVTTLIPNWHQTVLSREEFDQIVAEDAVEYPAGFVELTSEDANCRCVPSEPDSDGWIKWEGGECPVDANAKIEMAWSDGAEFTATKPMNFRWSNSDTGPNIIAYRPHKPEHVEPQYCESVMRSIPEPTTSTLDALLQDWRNADDYAQRKQTEADEAAAMRDERWKAVHARAGEMGVTVGRCESATADDEPELVITDWRDLMVGDRIWVGDSGCRSNCPEGEYDIVDRVHSCEGQPVGVMWNDRVVWPYIHDRGWRFIRRP